MKKAILFIFSIAIFTSACKEETPASAPKFPTDGLTPAPKTRALVLEATGAWCQFCPRGAELMLRINGIHQDDVVALALHGGSGTDPIKNPTSLYLLSTFLPGTGFPGFFVQNEDVPENDVMNALNLALSAEPELAVVHTVEETDTTWDVYAKVAVYKSFLNEEFMIQSYLVVDAIEARDFGGGFNMNQVSIIPYVQTGAGSVPTRWTQDQGIVDGVPTVKSGDTFLHLESVIDQSIYLPMGMPLALVNPFGKEYIEGDILGTRNTPIVLRIRKDPNMIIPAEANISLSVATVIWRLKQDGSGEYEYVNSYLDHVKK